MTARAGRGASARGATVFSRRLSAGGTVFTRRGEPGRIVRAPVAAGRTLGAGDGGTLRSDRTVRAFTSGGSTGRGVVVVVASDVRAADRSMVTMIGPTMAAPNPMAAAIADSFLRPDHVTGAFALGGGTGWDKAARTRADLTSAASPLPAGPCSEANAPSAPRSPGFPPSSASPVAPACSDPNISSARSASAPATSN